MYVGFWSIPMGRSQLVSIIVLARFVFLACAQLPTNCRGSVQCQRNQTTRSFTCTNLTDKFKNYCNGFCVREWKYWKLTLNKTSGAQCSPRNFTYKFECAKPTEITKSHMDSELCSLKNAGVMENNSDSDPLSCQTQTGQECKISFSTAAVKVRSPADDKVQARSTVVKLSNENQKILSKNTGTFARKLPFDPDSIDLGENPFAVVVVTAVKNGRNNSSIGVEITMKRPYPLKYLPIKTRVRKVEPICTFYDNTSNSWDPSVCNTTVVNSTSTKCSCAHNSAFAVMFAVSKIEIPDELTTTSTVLEIMSMVALFATFILLTVYRRKMRIFDRVLVQISLCIALFMTHLFLLLSTYVGTIKNTCQSFMVLGHYFLIVTAVAMVMEGCLLLVKVLFPNFLTGATSNSKRRRIIGFFVGWIAPAIYVGICAAFGIPNNRYGNFISQTDRFESCQINDEFNLIVVVPVAVALVINVLVAIRLAVLVGSMSKQAEKFKPTHERDISTTTHARKAFRAVGILLPILGIPWIVGFLINTGKPTELIFASIHVVINGLQGVCIFLHYVIFNSDMRTNIGRSWKSAMSDSGSFSPLVYFVSSTNSSTSNKNDGDRTDSVIALKTD